MTALDQLKRQYGAARARAHARWDISPVRKRQQSPPPPPIITSDAPPVNYMAPTGACFTADIDIAKDMAAELHAENAREDYEAALWNGQNIHNPKKLFAFAVEHPLAFSTWIAGRSDRQRLALLARLMEGAPR